MSPNAITSVLTSRVGSLGARRGRRQSGRRGRGWGWGWGAAALSLLRARRHGRGTDVGSRASRTARPHYATGPAAMQELQGANSHGGKSQFNRGTVKGQ